MPFPRIFTKNPSFILWLMPRDTHPPTPRFHQFLEYGRLGQNEIGEFGRNLILVFSRIS